MGNRRSALPLPAISSGDVVDTPPTQIVGLATALAHQSNRHRSCGIGIANMSEYSLGSGRCYNSSGRIDSIPSDIEPLLTGLILSQNRQGTPEGSCGLVTYDIRDEQGKSYKKQKLQVLWYVPLDLNINQCAVNVRIGVESASKDIFDCMYKAGNDYSYWCEAIATSHTFRFQEFSAEVLMSHNPKSSLIVKFKALSP